MKKARKIDVVFNYDQQKYFTEEGKEALREENWDFACNRCQGPAAFRDCDSYFEYCDCLNCGNLIKVN